MLLLYYHLWHNTCFVTNNLLWFNPGQQLSLTQPLAYSPLAGWGRKGASSSTSGKWFCPPVHLQNLWAGKEGGRERGRLRGNGYYNFMCYISACFPTFLCLPILPSTFHLSYIPSVLRLETQDLHKWRSCCTACWSAAPYAEWHYINTSF